MTTKQVCDHSKRRTVSWYPGDEEYSETAVVCNKCGWSNLDMGVDFKKLIEDVQHKIAEYQARNRITEKEKKEEVAQGNND
ncbi:MAG TPA: hypothetical protein VIP70_12085 [Nitrososphaeraceae archaeon]